MGNNDTDANGNLIHDNNKENLMFNNFSPLRSPNTHRKLHINSPITDDANYIVHSYNQTSSVLKDYINSLDDDELHDNIENNFIVNNNSNVIDESWHQTSQLINQTNELVDVTAQYLSGVISDDDDDNNTNNNSNNIINNNDNIINNHLLIRDGSAFHSIDNIKVVESLQSRIEELEQQFQILEEQSVSDVAAINERVRDINDDVGKLKVRTDTIDLRSLENTSRITAAFKRMGSMNVILFIQAIILGLHFYMNIFRNASNHDSYGYYPS